MTEQVKRKKEPRGRSTMLSRDRIVEAALKIADSEADLDKLTIRRLASELDVGPMTLYSYFRGGRDEILDTMADHALGNIHIPPVNPGSDESPAESIRAVAYAFLDMMKEHPSVSRLLSTRITDSHQALYGSMELVLGRLTSAGLSPEIAVQCYGFLISFSMGFVGYQTPRSWGDESDPEAVENRRQRTHFYAGLPMQKFPIVIDMSDSIVDLSTDKQFDFAIECFISGIIQRLG